jgi:catechol 2,3-dioxygenase-like lactoylglutathione lyase family enzyme
VIDVQRVDYIRVPVTDMEQANRFYGEVLGLERNPNSPSEDWVEYETGNVTLAVMTPHTHDCHGAGLVIRPATRSFFTTATRRTGRADRRLDGRTRVRQLGE